MAQKKYKVREPSVDEAIDLAGILSGGGLSGEVQRVLSNLDGAGITENRQLQALASLFMGAFANPSTRDEMRGFLFNIWVSKTDEEAEDADLNDFGRVKGEAYQKKMKEWRKLPMGAAIGIAKAFYESKEFKDFLALLRDMLPTEEESKGS